MEGSAITDQRRVPIGPRVRKDNVRNAIEGKKKKGRSTLPLQKKQEATYKGVRKVKPITGIVNKPPEGRISSTKQKKIERLNEMPDEEATNVENKPDRTDLDTLTDNDQLNKKEKSDIPETTIHIRKEIQQPRRPMESRKPIADRVHPTASVEAMNDFGKGVENTDRFSSLNSEPKVEPNKDDMDQKDMNRNINSELNRFKQFSEHSETRKEVKESPNVRMAKVDATSNKEAIREDRQVAAKPLSVFENEVINVFNNPNTQGIHQHANASKMGSWYLR